MRPTEEEDSKVHGVDKYPYLIEKPNQRESGQSPKYYRSHVEALGAISKDLESLRDQFIRLGDVAAVDSIRAGQERVGMVPNTGGVIEVLVDPYTGIKYRATLVKRERVL